MKVSKDQVMEAIVDKSFTLLPCGRTTICTLTLESGFTVRGEASVVDLTEFIQELGEKYAYEDALKQVWQFLGYDLAKKMHLVKQGTPASRVAATEEPTTFIGAGERHIAEQLSKIKTPVILVINKIDTVKSKEEILTFIAAYKDILNFAEIIPVSALKEMNIEDVKSSIFKYLPAGPQFYDEDTVTDQPMRQIAAELIREKALRMLDDEIPHGIAVVIDQMKERPNGIIDVDATIVCERDSHKGIIIGKGGSMLKRIGTAARMEIENLMDTKVNLKLWVKVRREWRDSDMYMKNYGYNPKEI